MQTAFARNGYAVKCRNIIVRRCHCHFEREPRNHLAFGVFHSGMYAAISRGE